MNILEATLFAQTLYNFVRMIVSVKSWSNLNMVHVDLKLGHKAKGRKNLVNTLEAKLVRIIISVKSQSYFNMG